MKFVALLVILAYSAGVLSSMRHEAVRQNDLHEKELLLQEIETVAKYCESKSGRVDYDKGDLVCNSKKEAQTKKFRPMTMPSDI